MDYKFSIVDEHVTDEEAEEIFRNLVEIIVREKNFDPKAGLPFVTENDRSATLIKAVWGTTRTVEKDLEEWTELYPELTFEVVQVSDVLNINHFEPLKNYTKFIYKDGIALERFKPEPLVWTSVHKTEIRPTPWG